MKNTLIPLLLAIFLTVSCNPTKKLNPNTNSDNLGSVTPASFLPPPANTDATDGIFENKIRVKWDEISGIGNYSVFRSTTQQRHDAQEITRTKKSKLTLPYLYDYNVEPGILYHYWVQCADTNGTKSELSTSDSGFIPETQYYVTPINFTPSTGNVASLEWSRVLDAENYHLQITEGNNDWSAKDGLASSNIILDTIINTNTFDWGKIKSPKQYAWSVKAQSEKGNSYYMEQQQVHKDILTTPQSPSFNPSILNLRFNDKMDGFTCAFKEWEEGLELLYFISDDDKIDSKDMLWKKQVVDKDNIEGTIDYSGEMRHLILVPQINNQMFKAQSYIVKF